jgi:microcin C transport system substrate-binding protein
MWSSKEANRPSSSNVTGFSDPRVDKLIEEQKTVNDIGRRNEIMRKIDAILSTEVPYVLLWNLRSTRLLYWNSFGMPDSVLSKYGDEMSVLSHWWYDEESASELKSAMKKGDALSAREENVYFDKQEKK